MDIHRSLLLLVVLALTTGATCNDPKPKKQAAASAKPRVSLAGIDTASLTPREHQNWSDLVSELLSPCKEVAVPVYQCVKEKRACGTCLDAAQFLLRQVQSGRPKKVIADAYADRFAEDRVKTIVLGNSPSKGSSDAPVTLVEFADFECGACGAAFPLVEAAFAKFKPKLRVVFKHFPLSSHPNAKLAAQAAYSAQKQGQFWRMHKLLFSNQERLTEPDLHGYAEKIGLDLNRFKKDLHSKEARDRVKQEFNQGESLGVDATPTIYINGRSCDLSKLGSNPQVELEAWIALELKARAGAKAPAATSSAAAAPSAAAAAPSAAAAGAASGSAKP